MGNRTIVWKEGGFVMFKAIMDSTLAAYLQPWFLDLKDFWWKRLGATPRSYALTDFVNGLRVRTVRLHPYLDLNTELKTLDHISL